MKPIFRFSGIIIFAMVVILLACHRKHVDYIGPAYVSAPEGFAVTSFTATPNPVDFSIGNVTFNAHFTNDVTWTLTITGKKSGAVHVIKGTSDSLNNIVWEGNHDGAIFFRAGETATATLSFFGTSLTSSLDIVISNVYNYENSCGNVFPRYGDFENPPKISSPYWNPYNAAESKQWVDTMAIDRNGNPIPSPQGKHYYCIKGLGAQSSFVDGIGTSSKTFTPPANPPSSLPADPNQVWVNILVYGTGDANAQIDVEYQEEDFDGSTPGYQGTDDDAWVAHIKLDHKGWKLFSFQYSKLVASANAAYGGSGNKIYEPNRLQSFDIILLKETDPNSPVEVYFDYPIITVGGPFKPCK